MIVSHQARAKVDARCSMMAGTPLVFTRFSSSSTLKQSNFYVGTTLGAARNRVERPDICCLLVKLDESSDISSLF